MKIRQPNLIKTIKKNTEKAIKRYQSLFKEEKEKSNNIVMNNSKICQKMKNKGLLSIEKNIVNLEKAANYSYKELFY